MIKGDGRAVGEEFLKTSFHECRNPEKFIDDMEELVLMAKSKGLCLAQLDVGELLSKVFLLHHSHHVKLDPNFVSVIVSIMVLEGMGRSFDPEIDLMWKAAPFLMRS